MPVFTSPLWYDAEVSDELDGFRSTRHTYAQARQRSGNQLEGQKCKVVLGYTGAYLKDRILVTDPAPADQSYVLYTKRRIGIACDGLRFAGGTGKYSRQRAKSREVTLLFQYATLDFL